MPAEKLMEPLTCPGCRWRQRSIEGLSQMVDRERRRAEAAEKLLRELGHQPPEPCDCSSPLEVLALA